MNTDKEFYIGWSKDELIKELCRVNAVLIGAAKDVEAVEKNLQEMKNILKVYANSKNTIKE